MSKSPAESKWDPKDLQRLGDASQRVLVTFLDLFCGRGEIEWEFSPPCLLEDRIESGRINPLEFLWRNLLRGNIDATSLAGTLMLQVRGLDAVRNAFRRARGVAESIYPWQKKGLNSEQRKNCPSRQMIINLGPHTFGVTPWVPSVDGAVFGRRGGKRTIVAKSPAPELLDHVVAIANGPDTAAKVRQSYVPPALEPQTGQVAVVAPAVAVGTASEPFVPTLIQVAILKALDGRALRQSELVAATGYHQRQIHRPTGIVELKKRDLVRQSQRIGYYRPDRPPVGFVPPPVVTKVSPACH